MIVLEGPDGAGKTFLADALSCTFKLPIGPKAATSAGGPVANLKSWVDSDLQTWIDGPLQIRDRHPIVSETIYGPVLRSALPPGFNTGWLRRQTTFVKRMSLVVWCLPPLSTVLVNLELPDAPPQLAGVQSEIKTLYWLYHAKAMSWPGQSVLFDYTTKEPETMISSVKAHIDRWTHG